MSGYALINALLYANQHVEELVPYREIATTGSKAFTLLNG